MSEKELITDAEALETKAHLWRTAHFIAGDNLRIAHYLVGLALIVLSAAASAEVLKSVSEKNPSIGWATGIISILVVILTSVQTTFKLGERAELHRTTATAFGRIKRDLRVFIDRPRGSLDEAWDRFQKINDDVANVEAGAPGFFWITFKRAERRVAREESKRHERNAAGAAEAT